MSLINYNERSEFGGEFESEWDDELEWEDYDEGDMRNYGDIQHTASILAFADNLF